MNYKGSTVTVTQSASGNHTASPSGVLQFTVSVPVSTVSAEAQQQIAFRCSPNPSSGKVNCTWNDTGRRFVAVVVTNAAGQHIGQWPVAADETQKAISMEKIGVYFVGLKDSNGDVVRQKVIIQ